MSLLVRRRMESGAGATPGGVKTVTGTITFKDAYNDGNITHNLGTQKVFGMIWLEPNEQNEVITTIGYDTLFATFITWERITEIFAGTTLVSNYTSSSTKTAAYPSDGYQIGGGIALASNWNNKEAGWNLMSRAQVSAAATDENTIHISWIGAAGPFCQGTYHYQIWALE